MSGTEPVPPRADWPSPVPATEGGVSLTLAILATMRLNGQIMEAAQKLAARGGLTAAWWQVLGGVTDKPRTIADVGRRMGVSRQAVQRIGDLLVDRGLAEYRTNPAHRRAKLLACTEAGYWAIRRISLAQHPWAARIAEQLDLDELTVAVRAMNALSAALEADAAAEQMKRAASD